MVRIAIILFCVGGAAFSLRSQSATEAPPPGHRWLFIIETSSSMRARSGAVIGAMQGLLTSGMQGELQPGDTIGIWTFNERLYTGQLPLQGWSSVTGVDVVLTLLSFLNQQTYEKHGNLEVVMPAMASVIKKSEFLTIILLSDGVGKITGTPFDDAINTAQEKWRVEQQKKKQPIVTILRVQQGEVKAWTVTPLPWPVVLPPLPPPPKVVEVPRTPPKPHPPRVIPSLYMSGRQPPAPPANTNAAPADATNNPAGSPGATNTPAKAE